MSEVILRAISKSFGSNRILNDISLTVESGKLICLLGPSGCGKTTLLRIVAGLEAADAGSVSIGGRDVTLLPPERRDIAMMFQSYALLPHLSAIENVRFPLRMRRRGTRSEQLEHARAALDTVKLEAFADRMPRQLSGGQQQRVALARAIVSRPQVLLLDEPLSNLDARLREDMQVELIELHRALGLTTLFVTHDQEEALSLADTVVLMNAGQIEQAGAPQEIYAAPRTSFASSFLGSANLIPVTITRSEADARARIADGIDIAIDGPATADRGTLALRQEDLQLRPPGSQGIPAVVETRVFLGARIRYVVRVGEHRLRCLASPGELYAPGDKITVVVEPNKARLVGN
jgi:iron(III) transport system ATP-binding protein/putative spermidine/putrescine transport system ATP-binding protein